MRFITLTTIAALAFASVSALPVNPSKGVGVPPKDIPLSKRTDELNGSPAPVDASGSGQSNGGRGIDKAKGDNTPQGQNSLSKRTDQIRDNAAAPPVAGNGIKKAKMNDTPQEQSPLSKRTDQVGDNAPPVAGNGVKKAKMDDTPQRQNPLSKRHKKSKGESGSGKKEGGAATTGEPNPLSKRTDQVNGDLSPGGGATGNSGAVNDAPNQTSDPGSGAATDASSGGPLQGLEDLL